MGILSTPKLNTFNYTPTEELFQGALNLSQQMFPYSLMAREKGARYLTETPFEKTGITTIPAVDYSKFMPTDFEKALATKEFENIWPETEKTIKHALSLSGMAYSPLLAETLGRERSKLGVDIGKYLTELGEQRATREQSRLISEAGLQETGREFDISQAMRTSPWEFLEPYVSTQRGIESAQAGTELQNYLSKLQQQQGTIQTIGDLLGTGVSLITTKMLLDKALKSGNVELASQLEKIIKDAEGGGGGGGAGAVGAAGAGVGGAGAIKTLLPLAPVAEAAGGAYGLIGISDIASAPVGAASAITAEGLPAGYTLLPAGFLEGGGVGGAVGATQAIAGLTAAEQAEVAAIINAIEDMVASGATTQAAATQATAANAAMASGSPLLAITLMAIPLTLAGIAAFKHSQRLRVGKEDYLKEQIAKGRFSPSLYNEVKDIAAKSGADPVALAQPMLDMSLPEQKEYVSEMYKADFNRTLFEARLKLKRGATLDSLSYNEQKLIEVYGR